jgi:hypothetical protein
VFAHCLRLALSPSSPLEREAREREEGGPEKPGRSIVSLATRKTSRNVILLFFFAQLLSPSPHIYWKTSKKSITYHNKSKSFISLIAHEE